MSRTTPERQSERSAWLERAESLHDVLSEHADESTQLRTLSETSVRALEAADIFAMAAPLEVGGHDVHPATQVEVFERLAVADVSSGWVAMIQSETAGVVGAHIADGAGLDAVFGDGFPRIAGTANPEGRARLDDDGHSLHGRWSFASGIRHCEWVLANAVVENAAPPSDTERAIPRVVGSIVPIGSVAIEDSWHVMGLEGTGSNHYQIDDVFVPKAFALPFGGRHIERGGPWFELPTITFLSPGHTGIALGSAKRALELSGAAASRVRFGSTGPIAARGSFQHAFGEASCRYEAARAYAMEVLDGAMAQRERAEQISPADDARIRAMVTWVTDACLEVVRFAHHAGGGAAAFETHPLQKVLRDLTAASQHIYVADSAYDRTGAFRLNQPPPSAL